MPTANAINSLQTLSPASSVTFTALNLSGLTASQLVATDGSKNLVSVSSLNTFITGTANQVIVTPSGAGVVLSTPQDIATTSSPVFANLSITGTIMNSSLTASQAVVTDGSKNLISMAYSATGGTSNIVSRDSNGNTVANNFTSSITSVVSAGATTTLSANSTRLQILTGTQNQTFKLPNATTLNLGTQFNFINNSTGTLSVIDNSSGAITSIAAGGYVILYVTNIGSAAGTWDFHELIPSNSSWTTVGLTVPVTSFLASGQLKLSGTSSGTVSILVQAAAGTFNFNLPITAGTSGYFLTSAGGASSPMTWTNPAASLVTSITGTASQVLANGTSGSAQVGAVTLTLPQSIATTSTPEFAALGLGIGASSLYALRIQVAAANTYFIQTSGTMNADDGSQQIGINLNGINFTPTNNNRDVYGIYNNIHATPSGTNTITNAYALLSRLVGTIGSGTVSNAFSGRFTAPSLGTKKWALNADDLVVGDTSNVAPTSGAYISGATYCGFSAGAGNSDKLQVLAALTIGATASSSTGALRLVSATSVNYIESGLTTSTSSAAPLAFTNMNSGTEWARFSSTGNFGVGSNDPVSQFNVGSFTEFRVNSSGNISTGAFGSDTYATDYSSVVSSSVMVATIFYGWSFTVGATDLFITKLGVNDGSFSSGSRTAAIYNKNGTLVTSVSVAKADTLNGKFRVASVTKIRLVAGNSYVIGALLNSGDTVIVSVSGQTYDSAITFSSGRQSGVLGALPSTDPTSDIGGGGFPNGSFAYNLLVTTFSVTASSGNAYTTGRAAIGTSSVGGATRFTVSAGTSDVYGSFVTGTQNSDDGASIIALLINSNLSPTSNNKSVYGIFNVMGATPVSTNTITNAYASFNQLGGTIGSGTVTNAYSGYYLIPTLGTNKHALHADNISVGASYIGAVAPPTNGAIVQGQSGFGTSSPGLYFVNISPPSPSGLSYALGVNGTLVADDGFNEQFGLTVSPSFSPNQTNTTNFFNIICQPTVTLSVNSSQYSGFYSAPTIATTGSNYSLTNFYGIRTIAPSKTGGGTITNAYNGFFVAPTFATNNTALYADNIAIGYTGVTPGTNYSLLKGRVGMGLSSPSYQAHISGDASITYVNASLGLTNTGGTTRTWVLGPRSDGHFVVADDTGGTIIFKLTTGKSVILSAAALATNATDGFTYIPTSAGTPTGAPTAQTGTVAMEYDTTNNKLYVYNGAWKSVTLT